MKIPMSPVFKELCEKLLTFEYSTGNDALKHGFVSLNERQAQAILDMRLARLTGLERDKLAGEATARPVHYQDVMATLYHNLGLNRRATVTDLRGRPHYLLDNRKPVAELI